MMWQSYNNSLKLLVAGLLLLLLSLRPSLSFSEGKIYLTDEEYNQIQEALTLSETELNLSKASQEQALQLLNQAQSISAQALNIQTTLSTQYETREASWLKREEELQKKINRQTLALNIGAVSFGVGSIIALIAVIVN